MNELKVDIWHIMLLKFKNNKNATKTAKKFVVLIAKVSSLTAKSENSFQSFILTICYWEMNPDQNIHQTLNKIFQEDWWNTQSMQKHSRISNWPQHIPIHHLLPPEKKKQEKGANWMLGLLILLVRRLRSHVSLYRATNLLSR